MDEPRDGGAGADAPAEKSRSKMEALLHHWLVEYNPAYLASAALVCFGLTLVSREVAEHDSFWAMVGIGAIAELYSFALIGGATFLVRLDQRRPAVMLGLLTVLFMADPMLQMETCSFLGLGGVAASATWLALFFVKLTLLARALGLRLSRSTVAVAALGSVGLAVLPHAFRVTEPEVRTVLVAVWLYALASAAVWTTRNVESVVGWDLRGRRSVHGAWALWGALLLAHAVFWAFDYGFDFGPSLAVVPLVLARFARRERTVWLSVAIPVAVFGLLAPQHLWLVATMGAATLGLVAARAKLARITTVVTPAPAPPYRSYEPLHVVTTLVTHDLGPRARPRFVVGALLASYLAVWSAGWTGGALPEHLLWLDAALLVASVAVGRHYQRPWLSAATTPVLLHLAVQRAWVSAPTSVLEWGATSVGAGFVLLFAALWVSWKSTLPRVTPPG